MNTENKFYQSVTGLALATGSLLLVPLIAMQFTDEVVWTLSDFIIMGTLIFGTGLTYQLVTRKTGETAYRVAVGFALVSAFLLIWVNGAVGIIGSENNPANQMYFGVLVIGIIGAFIARFKSERMALAMFGTAFAQLLVPIIALIIWPPQITSWGAAGVFGVFVFNAFFVLLLIVSAFCFRYAAQEEAKKQQGISNDTQASGS